MVSTTREQVGRGPVQPAFALTELAVRGATQLYGLQMSALRALSETHARTAAAFGFPDWTEWLRNGSEENLRLAAISTTQQVMETSRRTGEAVTRLGENLRELLQAQTGAGAQQWQKVIEQFGTQTTESLERFREVAEGQSQRLIQETEARVEAIAAAMQDVGGAIQQDDGVGEDPTKRGIQSNGAKPRSATRQH
jgi:hypothetical protein